MADKDDQSKERDTSEPDTIVPPAEGTTEEIEEKQKASSDQHEKEPKREEMEVVAKGKETEGVMHKYDIEPMLESIYQDTEANVDPAAIQALTEGFETRFLPSLKKAQSSIDQINTSQLVLIETVQQETSKFADCQAIKDLEQTMLKAKQYHNKLLKLRREMTNLHEKSKKLKKRALKLQQQKQKEELTRAHDMEKEYEKERMLTARVATSTE